MNLDKIIRQFTKTLTNLENLIEHSTREITAMNQEIEHRVSERERAQRIAAKLREIVQ